VPWGGKEGPHFAQGGKKGKDFVEGEEKNSKAKNRRGAGVLLLGKKRA